MGEGTHSTVTDVSPGLPADLVALRSRLEERWRTTLQQVQEIGLKIESMSGKQPGEGVQTLLETLFALSKTPSHVFLRQLQESPVAVVGLVELLLALAVGELMFRVGLDEVIDGSDADQMGGEPGRDTR